MDWGLWIKSVSMMFVLGLIAGGLVVIQPDLQRTVAIATMNVITFLGAPLVYRILSKGR